MTLFLLTGCVDITIEFKEENKKNPETTLIAEGEMLIHCIDVGQGDSTLIQVGEKNILIDAGENDQGEVVTAYLNKLNINTLDMVIGTHPHSDHVGGLDTVLHNFDVKSVYIPNKIHDSDTFQDFLKSIKKEGLDYIIPDVGDKVYYEDLGFQLTFLGPDDEVDYGESLNEYSLVTMIQFGDVKYLTGGDTDYDGYDDLLASGQNLDADIFHAFHHGSDNHTNTSELVDLVSADYVIASCGANNSYGHPNTAFLKRFSNSEIYRTDKNGNIIITIKNNGEISFNTTPTTIPSGDEEISLEDMYVGNMKTMKYHKADCSNLPYEENRVYFTSEKEAEDAGYTKSKDCFR